MGGMRMRNRLIQLVSALLCVTGGLPAAAHSARVGPSQPMGDGGYAVALWYGDGIMGPDPIRAIVLDADQRLVAVSPSSVLMSVTCDSAGDCTAWDRVGGIAYRPDPGAFETREAIRQNGAAFEYPEDYDHEFGFSAQDMTSAQRLRIEAGIMLTHPTGLLIAGLWWAVVWLSFAFGRVILRGGTRGRILRVAVIALTAFGATMLALVSVALAASAPTTGTMLLTEMAIGGVLAALVLWWRRRRSFARQRSGT